MREDIVLKIKEKEGLEILRLISIVFMIFLFFLALILKYQESVIQAFLILGFAFIIDVLNSGELTVSEKGINSNVTGFIKYKIIYRVELKNRILYIYEREDKKPYKIRFSLSEDTMQIENAYKFIEGKLKRLEEEYKDEKEYSEKFL